MPDFHKIVCIPQNFFMILNVNILMFEKLYKFFNFEFTVCTFINRVVELIIRVCIIVAHSKQFAQVPNLFTQSTAPTHGGGGGGDGGGGGSVVNPGHPMGNNPWDQLLKIEALNKEN